MGLLLGSKNIIEHISPLIISILIGRWKEAALASQPFSRANSFVDAAMAALSLTTGILVGEKVGTYTGALESGNHQQARVAIREAWRVGNAAITLALLVSSTAAIVYFAFPDTISHFFIASTFLTLIRLQYIQRLSGRPYEAGLRRRVQRHSAPGTPRVITRSLQDESDF